MCTSRLLSVLGGRYARLALIGASILVSVLVAPGAAENAARPYDHRDQRATDPEYCDIGTSPVSPMPPEASMLRDTLDLIRIAWAPGGLSGRLIIGDTDQDSLWEILCINSGYYCRIFENDGYDNYTLQQTLPYVIPWDTGDIDDDNLPDIVGESDNRIQLWESSAPNSHPSQLVWQSWPLGGPGHHESRIVDLDQDGKQEILLGPVDGVHIFECCGDNTFGWIFYADLGGSLGEFAVGDFDEDGWMEFAVGNDGGTVYVYECMGDDDFRRVATLSTGVGHSIYGTEAHDMDGNGRWEFVIGGSPSGGGYKWTIFESIANDTYIVTESIWIINGFHGQAYCDAGDVDGDGVEELVVRGAIDLHVYKAVDVGTYVSVAHYVEPPDTLLSSVDVHDMNRNGYDEILWAGMEPWGNTLILEDRRAYGQFELDVAASISIIPQGGTLSLDGMLVNLEATPETVDVWTEVILPGGEPFPGNPVLGPVRVVLAPDDTLTAHPSHRIPLLAPLGEYTYMGFVSSSYPLPILAADTLYFTVVEP